MIKSQSSINNNTLLATQVSLRQFNFAPVGFFVKLFLVDAHVMAT